MIWQHSKLAGATVFATATLLTAADARAAAAPVQPAVDLALVLAVDVSGSIDQDEGLLQRKGLADALSSNDVIDAIQAGPNGRIGVAVVTYAAKQYGGVNVPVGWTVVSDQASANAVSRAIMAIPYATLRGTSISDALNASLDLFATMPFVADKRAIEVSGDGVNNIGPPIQSARDAVLARGISISALPISIDFGGDGLDRYFSTCVIGGPGAFVQSAKGFGDFADAMHRNLMMEITGQGPAPINQPYAGPCDVFPPAAAGP